ncbi:MAG: sensor histidine kinase [Solirubrobacterales bacterium]
MSNRAGCTRTCRQSQESSLGCGDRLLTREREAVCNSGRAGTIADERLIPEADKPAQTDLSLRESEPRLHGVLEAIIAGVLIIDGQTHQIVDVNPRALEIVGLLKDQVIGRTCHRFICPTEQGHCPISDLGQTVDRSERIVLRSDGTRVPVLKSVTPIVWRGHQYLIESFVDISSLKQAQAEARESLSLFEATQESMADGLLVVDDKGRIKSYNKQFQALWRLPEDVLATGDNERCLSVGLTQLRDPQALRNVAQDLYAHPERQGHGILEFQDGRIVEYDSQPQRIGDRIIGRIWNFRDITEKYAAEQKQTALLRRVAEINEELSHFAYVVSHDLKAPLRGIKLIAEWLCADYGDKLDGDAKEQLDLLQSRVSRMHNLIDGVLQYSRVGRIKEDMIAVDLSELISGVIDGIVPPEHVRIAVQPGLPVIECEKTRITQVFQNLLGNAIKFMDKPAGEVTVGCVEDGDFWRFGVSDNGPGIEAKYFDRIFKLFQTLAPRDEFESSGVGLAVVKKIIEMYGGRVWVESEVGKGSTFFFTLPRRGPSPPPDGSNSLSAIRNSPAEGILD